MENFHDMSEYINYQNDKKYSKFLKKELIESFNESYNEFMNNSIMSEVEDNLNI